MSDAIPSRACAAQPCGFAALSVHEPTGGVQPVSAYQPYLVSRPAIAKVILSEMKNQDGAATVANAAAILRALDRAGLAVHVSDLARWEARG